MIFAAAITGAIRAHAQTDMLALLGAAQGTLGAETRAFAESLPRATPAERARFCRAVKGIDHLRFALKRTGLVSLERDADLKVLADEVHAGGSGLSKVRVARLFRRDYEIRIGPMSLPLFPETIVQVDTDPEIEGQRVQAAFLELPGEGRRLAFEWFYKLHLPAPARPCAPCLNAAGQIEQPDGRSELIAGRPPFCFQPAADLPLGKPIR